nr:MAG TPA: Receptor tyrosine-protein kinase erbB-3 [Caudoviricetes sp.]
MSRRNYDNEKENEEVGKAMTLGIIAGTIFVFSVVAITLIIKYIN